jgi:hypothetical protein
MRFGQGLAFVLNESVVFLRGGWWLAIAAGLPFSLSEMVRWGDPAPQLELYFAAHVLTAVLDSYLFLVVVRFVAGGLPLGQAMRADAATVRRFLPYAIVTVTFVSAQYYVYLTDQSERTYWLGTAVSTVFGALIAPWAVASAVGAANCGPRRSIRMAAPHLGWSLPLYGVLVLVELVGSVAIELARLPIPDIELAGVTFVEVGFGVQWLLLGSALLVASQLATIAVARRAGLATSIDDDALRETFS